jgi:hypothetical protein
VIGMRFLKFKNSMAFTIPDQDYATGKVGQDGKPCESTSQFISNQVISWSAWFLTCALRDTPLLRLRASAAFLASVILIFGPMRFTSSRHARVLL